MSNESSLQGIWDQDVATINQHPADWLWHGFVARGNITLLTSQWKAGKTTLLSLLLSRRKSGGVLAGLAVKPGKSIVISEEPTSLWAERSRRYDFGGNVCFFSQPFRGFPSAEQWLGLIDHILVLSEEHHVDLVVIDPLAPFCLGENNARQMIATLLPLRALTARGIAVVLLHHPGKGDRPPGQAARGSGALLGHVDISMEMRLPGSDPATRRRRFITLSRYNETPRYLLLDLNEQGDDYLQLPDTFEDDFQSHWDVVRLILQAAAHRFTRQRIFEEWPPDYIKPTRHTLWRWLDRAHKANLVAREGAGTKIDPFQYWLPEMEEKWKKNPFHEIYEQDHLNCVKLREQLERGQWHEQV